MLLMYIEQFFMKIKVFVLASLLMLQIMGQGCCEDNTIKVQGNAQIKVKPDIATISVKVQNTQRRSSDALSQVNTNIARVIDILKAQSIADDDYSTSSLSINPNYQWINQERVLTGQRAQQTLSVKIRDLSQDGIKIQVLLQELVKVSGVEINGVNFEQTDRKLGTRQARQEAYKSALKKAQAYQSLSGQPLRRVLRIKDTGSGNYIPFFSSAEEFISRPSLVPPKDVRVSASVQVIFGLSP